jgi:PAS fold
MLDGSKSLGSGHLARLLSSVRGRRKAKALPNDQELLRRIWAALKVARDNKALIISKDGAIVNVNSLASELCGRNAEELAGKIVVTELFESPMPARAPRFALTGFAWRSRARPQGDACRAKLFSEAGRSGNLHIQPITGTGLNQRS